MLTRGPREPGDAAAACEWSQPKAAQVGQPFQNGRRGQEGRTRTAMICQHVTRDR